MRTQQIQGIILLLVIIVSAVIYNAMTTKSPAPDIQKAQLQYETEKLQLKRESLKRYTTLKFYAVIGFLGAANLSLLILSAGIARARVKASSVHTAHIGEHSAIPVHYNDLQNFYPIAVNLSLAEIEASVSTSHDTAYRISRQMIDDITNYTRAIAGKRGLVAGDQAHPDILQAALPASTSTPTFAELLEKEMIGPGKSLVIGFHQGQPQYRSLKDLKSLAIAGWQGSGKTFSMAYLIASSVLAYGVRAYVVDPHKNHEEGLYSLIKPLEKTGHVTVINPFDTPALIHDLNTVLDRRLAGQESNAPAILLVIDELARLAKMECFDVLVTFLERCTEETRKANITFIGGSHKWTARHFKGRADIRGCMNSMLIHKTKPSQADLLVEDSHDKNLVKQIQRPGEAILVTDFDNPTLVSMPLCTREDMHTIVKLLHAADTQMTSPPIDVNPETHPESQTDTSSTSTREAADLFESPASSSSHGSSQAQATSRTFSPDVIPFDLRRKKMKSNRTVGVKPEDLSLDHILEQFQHRKQQDPHFTQAELARQTGLSPGHLSKVLRGQRPLTRKNTVKFYNALFKGKHREPAAIRR